jgi:hypothetical protein
MFIAPQGDPQQHVATVATPEVEVITVAVSNYANACRAAEDLVNKGCVAIELCGGFGSEGVAQVARTVRGRAAVGVVRFDHHPGLGHRSGDELF